ncbi:MAG: DNA methyltransferase, partial [Planctomycetaceae bacterium]
PTGRNLRTVWDANSNAFRHAHFATFPPERVDPCIDLGSREGDFVLDPFIGSGTTACVALNLERRVVGIELNPDYVQIAKRRLNGSLAHDCPTDFNARPFATDWIPPVACRGAQDMAD